MIGLMLRSGLGGDHYYMCTLDLDVGVVEDLLDGPLVEYNNFIPMLSVKLPYIKQLGYNATLKLDDMTLEQPIPVFGAITYTTYRIDQFSQTGPNTPRTKHYEMDQTAITQLD
jgi:hypothetical protein